VRRTLFEAEHETFRSSFRAFVERELTPHHAGWERDRMISREAWLAAGRDGFLCIDVPETYGGAGVSDYRYRAIITEELVREGLSGVGFPLHTDIVVPYITRYGSEEQKRRWLPRAVAGDCITAIAMSEPAAGSDLQGIQATAIRSGDHYLLNGQ
jgi:alkylation response protein AidB-like acyl-CoA dehydrogenase